MTPRLAQDASKLSFPLQLVITIIAATIAAYTAVWQARIEDRSAMAELRSDVRNIATRMEAQQQLWQERFDAMKAKADADAELRRVLLAQYERANQEFQNRMLKK